MSLSEPPPAKDRPSALAVFQAFASSPYPALRRLSIEHSGSAVVLRGTVTSFHLKQIAQGLAWTVEGVESVENLIHVTPHAMQLEGQ